MTVEELVEDDVAATVTLWVEAGLTRPWNDPVEDFQRAIRGAQSAVLGIKHEDEVIGTAMVGNDGHRGWVYYLAVARAHRREGVGRLLMTSAEEWLALSGVAKVQLMVRSDNNDVLGFYDSLGYELNDVRVLSRWLDA